MKPTKAQATALAEANVARERARDIGREHFASVPEAMLIEVARHAANLYPEHKELQLAFLYGYVEARRQHDAFKRGE